MKSEDINIEIEGDRLIVSGERSYEKEDKDEKIHRIERGFGSFKRMFRVPEGISDDHVAATYSNEKLKIAVAKTTEETKPRKVNITNGEDGFFKS